MTDSHNKLQQIIEAALLAAGEPLSVPQLQSLFEEGAEPQISELRKALESLGEACDSRGVELTEVASGWRLQVRSELMPWVSRLWEERPQRYSRALMETLALIAYRQPVTRGEIEEVRGVSVSSSIVRTLQEREWIRVVGYRDVPGKPALFGTTRAFLDYFNLTSLDQLPSLAEIQELTEPDPELEFPEHVKTPDKDRQKDKEKSVPESTTSSESETQSENPSNSQSTPGGDDEQQENTAEESNSEQTRQAGSEKQEHQRQENQKDVSTQRAEEDPAQPADARGQPAP